MKYRGAEAGTGSIDVNMETRELHQFKNEDMRVSPSILCASVLESMGSKEYDVNMEIRKIHPLNNKDMRLISFKLDASVLDLTGIQSHWYADKFPIHTNASSVAICSSVLLLLSISRRVRDMKITRIVPNTNLLKYLIPPPHSSSNIFVEHKLNHVSLKFTNTFKETSGSRIIIVKKGGFQLMGYPSKTQQCMSMLFRIIQERCN